MTIKDSKYYTEYLIYLKYLKLSKEKYSLYKISSYSYEKFKEKYENSDGFKENIDKYKLSYLRSKKIISIIGQT